MRLGLSNLRRSRERHKQIGDWEPGVTLAIWEEVLYDDCWGCVCSVSWSTSFTGQGVTEVFRLDWGPGFYKMLM